MTVGTKSVLYGAHQFAIHPWFVAYAWWTLYGFPLDPRLWVAFFVHDLGYVGKPNMDGPEGETHVLLGARIMNRLFDGEADPTCPVCWGRVEYPPEGGGWIATCGRCRARKYRWFDLCLYHSRFYAKQHGRPFSRLCVADKLALANTPAWLYLPMVRWTGEIDEYMRLAESRNLVVDGQRGGKYSTMQTRTGAGERQWFADVQDYVRRWAHEHRDGRQDTWTPAQPVDVPAFGGTVKIRQMGQDEISAWRGDVAERNEDDRCP